ncbi:hypothetical protein RISK_001094 [Rhodopirellula islandica]|uniref:Uncharacterized protein n=1 Tax=Rhodopirellula islandica TaxID=595434 RepID=A0A0J1BJP4_RHOIS|nr:hypothetical protein RISK_001094 [Rhodopirellula islandica]
MAHANGYILSPLRGWCALGQPVATSWLVLARPVPTGQHDETLLRENLV